METKPDNWRSPLLFILSVAVLILIFLLLTGRCSSNNNAKIDIEIADKQTEKDSLINVIQSLESQRNEWIYELSKANEKTAETSTKITKTVKPRKYETTFIVDTSYMVQYNFIANHKPRQITQ